MAATIYHLCSSICIHQKLSILRFNPSALEVSELLPIETCTFHTTSLLPFLLLVQLSSTLRGSLLTSAPLITCTSATPDPTIWTSLWSKAHPFIMYFPQVYLWISMCWQKKVFKATSCNWLHSDPSHSVHPFLCSVSSCLTSTPLHDPVSLRTLAFWSTIRTGWSLIGTLAIHPPSC